MNEAGEPSESISEPTEAKLADQTEAQGEREAPESVNPTPQPAEVPGKNQLGMRLLRGILGGLMRR